MLQLMAPGAHMYPGISSLVLFHLAMVLFHSLQKEGLQASLILESSQKGGIISNCSPSPFQHAWPPQIHNLLQSGLWTGLQWIPNTATQHSYSWSHLNKGTPGTTLLQDSNASPVLIRPLKSHKQFDAEGQRQPQKWIKTREKLEIKSNNTPFSKPQSECMISG